MLVLLDTYNGIIKSKIAKSIIFLTFCLIHIAMKYSTRNKQIYPQNINYSLSTMIQAALPLHSIRFSSLSTMQSKR